MACIAPRLFGFPYIRGAPVRSARTYLRDALASYRSFLLALFCYVFWPHGTLPTFLYTVLATTYRVEGKIMIW